MTTYTPGQVLTAAELNTSFGGKTDNSAANITGGSITGLSVLNVSGTTDSGSVTTGALTVAGGVGIGLSLQVGASATIGGQAFVNSNSNSTSLSTGALVVAGGVAVGLNLNVGANLSVSGNAAVNGQVLAESTADSTSIGTGAVVVSGGVGVAKSLFVGGSANVAGNVAVGGGVTVTGAVTTSEIILSTGGLIQFQDGSQQSTAGAINGELSVPTTGGTVTPTAAQVAANSIFNVNGVLTSNVTLVLPASPKVLTVANNTTNASSTAYTLTVKVTGQTPSTTVAQGKASTLYTDTTGAYATSAASGFQFSGQANDPTGLTYDITYSGKIVYQTASGIASKMPSAASYAAGAGLAIKNVAAATTTLATQGTDTFDDGITSPLTMQPNDCICYVSDGVSVWRAAWYSNHVKPKFTAGVTFPDGTVQTTANSTTQPAAQWYTVGTTDTVGSFADGDTAIRTSGFTAPFVKMSKNGLTMVRGQHFTLNADGIHINLAEPLIATDEVNVETQGVYNPSSTFAPSLPWVTPAAGATFIAYPHVVGFAWLMLRGAFLQAGTDYTEDATGFYLVGFAADGVEQYGIFNLNAVSIANALLANAPVIVASSGAALTFQDGTKQGTAAVGRNRLINGDFRTIQRPPGTPAVGTVAYMIDRWYCFQAGAAGAVTTIAGNPNYNGSTGGYYGRVAGVAGNTASNFGQRIEATNIADLAAKSVTLSGSMIRTLGGTVNVYFYTPTTVDGFGTNNAPVLVGQVTLSPNVWANFRFTTVLPASAINGLQVEFDNFTGVSAGLGAGDFFAVTDVQLEAGNNPNPVFERRDISEELRRCQRYYQTMADFLASGYNAAGGAVYNDFPFRVSMRIAPAGALLGTVTYTNASGYSLQPSADKCRVNLSITAAGYGYGFGSKLAFDAEL